MTDREKKVLIDRLRRACSGDYYEVGFLEGLVFGLNLRRGSGEKLSVTNVTALYEGDKEVFRCE